MNATQGETTPSTYRSTTCPICHAVVLVWRSQGLPARLLRALALAEHAQTLHPVR